MTTSGPAGKAAGQQAADPAMSPGFGGPDAPDDGAPRTVPHADAAAGPPDDVQELRQEIEQTREELGETVEQLVAKADVKARARDKAAGFAGRVKGKTSQARTRAAARAGKVRVQLTGNTSDTGQGGTLLGAAASQKSSGRVAAAAGTVREATPEPVRQAVAKAASSARQRRLPLAAAAGVLIAGYLAIRWRGRQ